MLMRVVETGLPDGLLKTEYVNRKGNMPYYLNRKGVLHDPARFGIGQDGELTRAGCQERPVAETTLGDF